MRCPQPSLGVSSLDLGRHLGGLFFGLSLGPPSWRPFFWAKSWAAILAAFFLVRGQAEPRAALFSG